LELGLWIMRTSGNVDVVLEIDRQLMEHRSNWFVREVINMLRRTLSRLDVSSRSIYAVVEEGSCFAGTLFELALASDRTYMLSVAGTPDATFVALSEMNFAHIPMANGLPRVVSRFYQDKIAVERARSLQGK